MAALVPRRGPRPTRPPSTCSCARCRAAASFLVACGIDTALDRLEACPLRRGRPGLPASRSGCSRRRSSTRLGRACGSPGRRPGRARGRGRLRRRAPLTVTAPIVEAPARRDRSCINLVGYETMVASKAARVTLACAGGPFVDFSARRDHGVDAAMQGARAAFVGGAAATSLVLAGPALRAAAVGHHGPQLRHGASRTRSTPSGPTCARTARRRCCSSTPTTPPRAPAGRSAAMDRLGVAGPGRPPRLRRPGRAGQAGPGHPRRRRVHRRRDPRLGRPRRGPGGRARRRRRARSTPSGWARASAPAPTRRTSASSTSSSSRTGEPRVKLAPGKETLPGRKQVWRYADHDLVALAGEDVPPDGAAPAGARCGAASGSSAPRARRWPRPGSAASTHWPSVLPARPERGRVSPGLDRLADGAAGAWRRRGGCSGGPRSYTAAPSLTPRTHRAHRRVRRHVRPAPRRPPGHGGQRAPRPRARPRAAGGGQRAVAEGRHPGDHARRRPPRHGARRRWQGVDGHRGQRASRSTAAATPTPPTRSAELADGDPGAELYVVLGSDAAAGLDTWERVRRGARPGDHRGRRPARRRGRRPRRRVALDARSRCPGSRCRAPTCGPGSSTVARSTTCCPGPCCRASATSTCTATSAPLVPAPHERPCPPDEPRTRPGRSAVVGVLGLAAAVAVPVTAVVGVRTIADSKTGEIAVTVPGETVTVLPDTPGGLLVEHDAEGALVGVTVFAVNRGGAGGTAVVVPTSTVITGADGTVRRITDVYAEGGLTAAADGRGNLARRELHRRRRRRPRSPDRAAGALRAAHRRVHRPGGGHRRRRRRDPRRSGQPRPDRVRRRPGAAGPQGRRERDRPSAAGGGGVGGGAGRVRRTRGRDDSRHR